MDSFIYKCHYCGGEYEPKRRFKQKYCSSSCRVNAFKMRKKSAQALAVHKKAKTGTQIDKMSWSGIGNAAVGNIAVNMATRILTREEDKPVTKGDIKKLIGVKEDRFLPIKNAPLRNDGARPYFDTRTQLIIYKK